MNFESLNVADLTEHQLRVWRGFARTPPYDSPFFHPEFVRQIATLRESIEVAVIRDEGRICGFLPYQRCRHNVARPVGGPLADLQGAIVRTGLSWSAREALKPCRLSAWHFSHVPKQDATFGRYHTTNSDSPYMDLSEGIRAYEESRRRSGSRSIPQVKRKLRKMEREIGPLRFESHLADADVLAQLISWKSLQRRRTGTFDVLQVDWVVELLRALVSIRGDGFGGMLSAVFARDELVAVHLGLRTETVLHYWFPTYNPAYAHYSPGLILLWQMASAAAEQGIRRFDFGPGQHQHKTSFANGSLPLVEGTVSSGPVAQVASTAWQWARNAARMTQLGAVPRRWARRVYLAHLLR